MSIDKYVEEAQRFSELAKKYGSAEKASEKLGISLKRFYEVLKRLKVENNVLELLKKSGKKISRKHLETLGRMPPKMQLKLAKLIVERDLSADQLKGICIAIKNNIPIESAATLLSHHRLLILTLQRLEQLGYKIVIEPIKRVKRKNIPDIIAKKDASIVIVEVKPNEQLWRYSLMGHKLILVTNVVDGNKVEVWGLKQLGIHDS